MKRCTEKKRKEEGEREGQKGREDNGRESKGRKGGKGRREGEQGIPISESLRSAPPADWHIATA